VESGTPATSATGSPTATGARRAIGQWPRMLMDPRTSSASQNDHDE
jgi:hypothetical protein